MAVTLVSKELIINSFRGPYEVKIINKEEEKSLIPSIFKSISTNSFLIVDEKLIQLYPFIKEYWHKDLTITIKACEDSKTLTQSVHVIKKLIESGFKRNMTLVALGGGVIQDLTSFISSILFRGVDWIFVPTTLLSQADSCIGSKTSINFHKVKNILGTFYPPKKIFSFLSFLDSLDIDEIKSGLGEILHYYFVEYSYLKDEIRDQYDDLINNRKLIENHIYESLAIKKKMVEKDEFDKGPRAIFNYGHTFGHALEVIFEFKVSHGQAVTRGMDLANFIAFKENYITRDNYKYYRSVLEKNFPKLKLKNKEINSFIELLKKDKKASSKEIICILPKSTNQMIIHPISNIESFYNVIDEYINLFW